MGHDGRGARGPRARQPSAADRRGGGAPLRAVRRPRSSAAGRPPDGYDATRMVVPGLRRQIVREYGGSAVYAVPMDDVFVALPLELVERGEHGGAAARQGGSGTSRPPTTRSAPSSSSSATASSPSQVSPVGGSGVWAVLVAAGRGERFGGDRPKAFANLAGRPLLAESLERLEAPTGSRRSSWSSRRPSGRSRASCSLRSSARARCTRRSPAGPRGPTPCAPAWPRCRRRRVVVVHDAARPLLPEDVVERVVTGLGEGWDGVVPALAAGGHGQAGRGRGRRGDRRPHRPLRRADAAGLPGGLLRRALAGARDATDCAGLVEAAGGRVRLVEGDRRLVKVTTPADLDFVETLLEAEGDRRLPHAPARPATGARAPIELTVEAVERFVEQAAARGVDEIAFTEHMYYFRQAEPFLGHPYHRSSAAAHDLDDYCDAVLEAKRRGLPVKLGLEVDVAAGSRRGAGRDVLARTRGTSCSARCTSSTARRSTWSRASGSGCPSRRSGAATSPSSATSRGAVSRTCSPTPTS